MMTPRDARASEHDVVVVNVLYGATFSNFGGDNKTQPSLWLDGSYGVVGPLHIGGYFQFLGEGFALSNPGYGGGAFLALRKNVSKARLSAAFGGGGLGVPVPRETSSKERTGTLTAFLGLGYGFLDFLGIELRGRWARYFGMPPETPNNAWSLEGGLTIFIQ